VDLGFFYGDNNVGFALETVVGSCFRW